MKIINFIKHYKRTKKIRINHSFGPIKNNDWNREDVYELMNQMSRHKDIEDLGKDIVNLMIKVLDCIGGALFILDEKENKLKPFTYSSINVFIESVIPLLNKPFRDHLFDLKEGSNKTVRCALEKMMFIGPDYEAFMMPFLSKMTSRSIQKMVGMQSIVSAPIIFMGKVMGVFQIGFREKSISKQKKQLIEFFSDQCAILIHTVKKYYANLQEFLNQESDFLTIRNQELRTPLTVALFQARHLAESLNKTKSTDLHIKQKEAQQLVSSLQRLQGVTEKISVVQAYDAKKIKLYLTPTNLHDFCAIIYYKFKPLMEKASLEWEIQNQLSKKFTFIFDTDQIEKLLTELITNAIHFTPEKGKVTLKVFQENSSDSLYFAVIDTGEGIPKNERGNIFKKFKSNHSMQAMGIGLGLYIVKKVVELHQGDIVIEGTPGGGATFVVSLPKLDGDSV